MLMQGIPAKMILLSLENPVAVISFFYNLPVAGGLQQRRLLTSNFVFQ